MWEVSYGKEPFDLKLTVLCLIRRTWLILAVTILGTIVFGGGYYVKNILLGPEPDYSATSVYRVDFAIEKEPELTTVHINEMTWNTYVDTQMFLDQVRSHLPAGAEFTDEELREAVSVTVASNLKVVSTVVTTGSPERSLLIASAVEAAMVQDFPGNISEITGIFVMDPAKETEAVYPDVRLLRAVALSALLSLFFAVVVLLLKELGDDNIRLPSILRRRYGLKVLGTPKSFALKENMGYLFAGKKKVALCPVQEAIDPARVMEELCSTGAVQALSDDVEWILAASPVQEPKSCRVLREADGILLAVSAGNHSGKQLEYVLEYLEQQECKVTAAILIGADEWLLRQYYRFGKDKI